MSDERTHHRTGVPGEHRMTAWELAQWAKAIDERHHSTTTMPEATVHLPAGIWFNLETVGPISEDDLKP